MSERQEELLEKILREIQDIKVLVQENLQECEVPNQREQDQTEK